MGGSHFSEAAMWILIVRHVVTKARSWDLVPEFYASRGYLGAQVVPVSDCLLNLTLGLNLALFCRCFPAYIN